MQEEENKPIIPALETSQIMPLSTADLPVLNEIKIEDLLLNISNSNSSSWGTLNLPQSNYTFAPTNFSTNINYGVQSNYQTNPSLQVNGKVEIKGEKADIEIEGKSLKHFMEVIERRFAILQPHPEKLEKFEALRKAYEHYKLLESLCDIEDKKED
jgi:hypothetical protein